MKTRTQWTLVLQEAPLAPWSICPDHGAQQLPISWRYSHQMCVTSSKTQNS